MIIRKPRCFDFLEKQTMEGKKTLLLFVVLGWTIIGLLFLFYGYEKTWRLWGIPTMTPNFADLRGVISGADTLRLGSDPLIHDIADPYGRQGPLNYPRIWSKGFLALGVNQSHATYIGILFIFLFITGVFLFSKKIDNVTALFLTFGIFSPAVLLGIERANCDLLIFFILSLALFFLLRSSIVFVFLIIAGIFLKLFPVFGLSCLLKENRKRFTSLAVISFIIILIYVGLNFKELVLIRESVPRGVSTSFGTSVLWMVARNHLGSPAMANAFCFLTYSALLFLIIFTLRSNRHKIRPPVSKEHNYIDSFRMGSAIYVGLFLWGNNYDYKLMFLLFVMPQVIFWARHESHRIAMISKLTMLAIIISLWYMFILHFMSYRTFGYFAAFLLDQLSDWMVFGGLLYLFFYSLPEWVVITRVRRNIQ